VDEKRYFTVQQANGQVRTLEERFARIMQIRAQLKPLYARLESQKAAPKNDDFEPHMKGVSPDVLRDRVTFKGLLEVLKGEVGEIQELGCMIKDIETGLVDWFGKNGGHDVLLCWRFGEKEVAYFHDLEAGIAGRRPVSELMPPS
jgi:hypothetical protein